MSQLEQFFSLLFCRPELGSYASLIEIRAIAPAWFPTNKRILRSFHGSVDQAIEHVEGLKDKKEPYNIYFGVLPRTKRSGSLEAIKQGATLWVDIDIKQVGDMENAHRLLTNSYKLSGHPASVVVETGRGLHAYWLLDRPSSSLAGIHECNQYLASTCLGDSVGDPPRILRAPTTLNWKDEHNPKECKVLSMTGHITPFQSLLDKLQIPTSHSIPKAPPRRQLILSPVGFSLDGLTMVWRNYIHQGIAADKYGYYHGDKSRLDFAVVGHLLKKGFTEDQIYSIFTNPSYGISEKTLSKPTQSQEAYLSLTIQKASERIPCPF